eukprot:gene2599-2901_t
MQEEQKQAAQLREASKEPYAYRFDRTHYTADLQQQYSHLEPGQDDPQASVAVAGRVVARRVMGKLAFLSVRDDRGQMQIYVDKARLEEQQPGGFSQLKALLDVGDIVGARGSLKRTDKGELSVVADELSILTKSLLPLPDKWHGLADVEKRYRQRYLDLIVSDDTRATFRARSKVISAIRRHLEDQGFLEVETPVLESVAGGADARPFVTYHNALGRPFTLRIATELHLKRMVVGGFERVFELGRVFRNEGVSSRHNPEFTSVEVYQAYADYTDMMNLTESLLRAAATAVTGGLQISYQGVELDLSQPFRRVSMNQLVLDATGLDVLGTWGAGSSGGAGVVGERGQQAVKTAQWLDQQALQRATAESSLLQPTFVLEHPVEISPLAKPHRSKPGVTERFELFVYGRELANAFSELTDPVEQRLGIGVDRLVMLLTDSPSIRDVIAFPLMK